MILQNMPLVPSIRMIADPSTGRMIIGCAVLLLFLVSLVGVIVALRRMKSAQANRKCHLSFVLFGLGWLMSVAISAIATASDARALRLFGFFVFVGFAIAAVWFAIRGLSEVKHEKRGQTGAGTAVATLVLAGILFLLVASLIGFGVLKGIRRSFENRALNEGGSPEPAAVFEDLGFALQPPRPWVRVDAKKFNPDATLAYMRARPQIFLMVIAEDLGEEDGLELDGLVEIVKANLASAASRLTLLEEREETVNGLSGWRLVYEATIDGHSFKYRQWMHVTPHRAYQLMAWCRMEDDTSLMGETEQAFGTFRLLPRD